MSWPWETRTSTCVNFATISSGLYRFLAIAVLLDVETYLKSDHFVGGGSRPVRWVNGESTMPRQNKRISASDRTRRPTFSWPRFRSRWHGLNSTRPASNAKVKTVLIRLCIRLASVGVPLLTKSSTSSITSARLIEAYARLFHLGRTWFFRLR